MSSLPKLLLCLCLSSPFFHSSKASHTESYDDERYETYKAQSLIPLDKMSKPDWSQFLPENAKTFELDTSSLAFPATTGIKDLFKHALHNDVILMLYCRHNRGMTRADQMAIRLQAFTIVLDFVQHFREKEGESALPPLAPIFQFTDRRMLRLHSLIWRSEDGLHQLVTKKIKEYWPKRPILRCKEKTSKGKKITYARFASIKERQLPNGCTVHPGEKQERHKAPPAGQSGPHKPRKSKFIKWYR